MVWCGVVWCVVGSNAMWCCMLHGAVSVLQVNGMWCGCCGGRGGFGVVCFPGPVGEHDFNIFISVIENNVVICEEGIAAAAANRPETINAVFQIVRVAAAQVCSQGTNV